MRRCKWEDILLNRVHLGGATNGVRLRRAAITNRLARHLKAPNRAWNQTLEEYCDGQKKTRREIWRQLESRSRRRPEIWRGVCLRQCLTEDAGHGGEDSLSSLQGRNLADHGPTNHILRQWFWSLPRHKHEKWTWRRDSWLNAKEKSK